MEAVAGSVIDRAVGSTLTRIKKELGYWFSSRKNVEAMNKEIKRLKDAAEDIKEQMKEHGVRGIPWPPHISTWLNDVEDIKEEAKKIPTDGIGIGCFNIKMRYKAGKQSFDILQNLTQLKDIPQFESTGEKVLASSRNHASTSSAPVDDITPSRFETRDVIFKKALECLEPNNRKTQIIALCGMGGVGKTHMIELLMKHVAKNMFDYVLKVDIEQNPGLKDVQNALAEQMGGPLTEETSDIGATRLKNRFGGMSEDGKMKILVILDGLWEEVRLPNIGLTRPLPDGFKLLITSRTENVCTKMGVDSDSDAFFNIGPLNDDEAKRLFFDIVGLSKDDDPHLYNIGEDIISRCGNLPIALETFASTLKGHTRDDTEWEEALSHLQHHNLKDHYGTVKKVFQISFDRLKRDDAQAIFLLSGLFPDGFEIPVEELMRYAWGLKLLHLEGNTTLAQARRRVKVCVNELISANLLVKSDCVQFVKMNELARSFALDNISQVKQASILNHDDISKKLTKDANGSYQRILLKCTVISEFPNDFNCPNLTFLKLMSGEEKLNFPDRFYKNMKKLNVLSYEEMFHPPLLPRSSQFSTHLRTLCLHGCELIFDWSAFGYLLNLEVLSFAHSHIKRLPSVVGKLKKLKLLELTGCSPDLSIDSGVFRDLEQLEELYMRVSGWKAISFTDANCRELEVLSSKLTALEVEFFENNVQPKNMSLRQLKRFKISIGCLLEGDRDIYSFENTLKLVTSSNELQGCNINMLFNETEKLHLQVKDMKHIKDITMTNSFSKLRVLEVVKCVDLRYLFTVAMASSLRKLERLIVSSCPVLKSLIHGEQGEYDGVEVIKFKELKFLALNNLPDLESLCDTDTCVELPQLVELRLDGLPNFTTIYSDNARQAFFNNQVVIPKLEKLKISSMKKLMQIWPSEIITSSSEEIHLSMIRVMKVQDCDRLINLFPTNPMHLLHNLEKLLVKSCLAIEVLFNIDLGSFGKIEDLSSLRSIHVVDSGNLSGIWRVKGANNPRHLINGFKAAEKIHIRGCRSFGDTMTTPTNVNYSDMRALVDIKMQDSEDSVFSRALKSLWPNNKTQMIALCGMGGVGKTHMMERLKKAVEDFKMFYRVVKVVVGQNTEVASLQHFVSEIMGGALTETTGDARAESLKNRFAVMSKEGEKKILVILDDVWEVLDLKDIGLSSPLPNGLKLLLTSRDAYVCSQMGVEKSSIFTLTFSYEQDAKALFYESAGLDHCDADPELHEIAEQFVDRCHGIPIVIRTLAISLRGESKYAWEDQLRRLKHFLGNDNIDVVFRLSFENLSEKNKAICVLSGLFPEDTDIPMEELMRYAWGLKLLPAVSTIAEARQIIETSANTLVYARLLTRSDHVGCVRTHDLLHDFALSTDKQAFIDHNNMPENDSGESLERIYIDCTGMSEFPVPFDYPNLKLLKLMGEKQLLKFPQDFYDRMKNLEVVAFERIDDPLLPHFSFNLRTLRLDSCSLMDDDFSFLENLNNLEILIFARCGIRKLPSTVGKLRKLKLLDVTGCSDDLCIDDGVFEDLDMLEELYLRVDGSKAICFTDANCEELEILSRKLCALEVELYDNKLHIKDESFKNLEKFKISMGCLLDDNSIESSLDDNTLKLVTNLSDLLECKINELFLKTNILYLQVNDMKNLEEVSMRYSFINLRKLEVSNCADLTFLFTVQVASDLTKLRDLKVSSCPVLETMIDGKSDGGSMIMFPNLKSLSLNDLPCLMRLCNTDNGLDLRELVDLTLDGLPNFTTIYPDNAEQQYSFFNNQVQLPNLEKLKISSMNKLKQIWPCEITTISSSEEEDDTNISKLREIEVEGCDNLKNLFPCNPLPLLNQLKELCVKNCGSVEVLFDMDLTFAGNIKEVRSSLESIRVEKLKKLRKIWRIKGANKSGLAIRCFQDVKAIHIQNCTSFRDLFAPTNINFVIEANVTMPDEEYSSQEHSYYAIVRGGCSKNMVILCFILLTLFFCFGMYML